jgi:hypothetical protein
MKSLSIEDPGLLDFVAEAAQMLLTAHPEVVFTSGRRAVKGQADAMASNGVQRRNWIQQTYVKTAERDALQKWIEDHPEATTRLTISAGPESVMNGWTDEQKRPVSLHFSGQAFDVQPVANGDAVVKTIKSLSNLRQFLELEGCLRRWHTDFEKTERPSSAHWQGIRCRSKKHPIKWPAHFSLQPSASRLA